ncbi:MAG: nucleotidyltransferase domain-containing protein [Firmicutes bacterium]|nr:nucleotidyltransferase domain-containing protein [Bacillota bacterium]
MVLNQEILNITEAIKAAIPVEKIYLFGSHAYGTPNHDSDYDFFVVIPNDGPRPLDAAQSARVALIPLKRKTAVDILVDYQRRFDDRRQYNTLERKIFENGVILYEQA